MEGQGTDMNLARDYFKRVDRIDQDVHELKGGFTNLTASVARLEAGAQANNALLQDLADKLDTARTQKTPIFVVIGALVAGLGAALAWQTAFLAPIERLTRDNYLELREIRSTRYTDSDAVRDNERITDRFDALEERDQSRYDRLDERLRHLERGGK